MLLYTIFFLCGYLKFLNELCDWTVLPEICFLFHLRGETLRHFHSVKGILYNVLNL